MLTPRPPSQEELPRVIDFLNKTLRKDSAWSITEEYPTTLSPNNLHNMRILCETDSVLSHAVIKPLVLKTPQLIYKVATIGSVVTSEAHRGQGLSKKIIESCLTEARNQSCDFAILWSSLHDFYAKMDFALAGVEEAFIFEKPITSPLFTETNKFIANQTIAPEAILKLYSQHTVGSLRTSEEIKKFLKIPNTQVYSLWSSSNKLLAYAIEGKGADLTNYVHEWGGSVEALFELICRIQTHKQGPFTFISPAHSVNLIQRLAPVASMINQGYLGLIKIVHHQSFFAKIHRAARSLGIQQLKLESTPKGIVFGINEDIRIYQSSAEIVPKIFGPDCEFNDFTPASQEQLSRLFPLPLWLWGWDSI